MIVEMRTGATQEQVDAVIERARQFGFDVQLNIGTDKYVVAILGSDTGSVPTEAFAVLAGVQSVTRIMRPFKLASHDFRHERTIVHVGSATIGGDDLAIIAGPCSIESREQLFEAAQAVIASGACLLRGGAFKPRTSPYAFQGLRGEGVRLLLEAKKETGLPIVTEIMSTEHIDLFTDVDVIQVGARNMQNFELLKLLGESKKPVLLKRGLSSTLEELLMSAEYIMAGGNPNVILCERGIRTFESFTRNTLDISAVPVLKELSHLPVMVDPSHAAGLSRLVRPLSLAAAAAGADGLMIEVHNDPAHALSDGPQSLTPDAFDALAKELFGLLPHLRGNASGVRS